MMKHTKSWRSWAYFDIRCVANFGRYTMIYLNVLKFDLWRCPFVKTVVYMTHTFIWVNYIQWLYRPRYIIYVGTADFSRLDIDGHRFITLGLVWWQVTRWSTWLMTFARFARTFSASNRGCWNTWSAPQKEHCSALLGREPGPGTSKR